MTGKRQARAILAAAAAGILLGYPVLADVVTKTDTTTLSAASDWSATPAATDIGLIDGQLDAANAASLQLGGDLALAGLQFGDNLTGSVIIGGSGTLTLSSAGLSLGFANQDVTLNHPIALALAQTWSGFGPGKLTVTGPINTGGGNLLQIDGNAEVRLSGTISGEGGLTKSGPGTLILAANETYTGITTLSGGTLVLDYTGDHGGNKLADSPDFCLQGGTLVLRGGTASETTGVVRVQPGASTITREVGSTTVLQMSGTGRTQGGTLNLSAAGIATTTAANESSGIFNSAITVAGNDWAKRLADGTLSVYAGYTDLTASLSNTSSNAICGSAKLTRSVTGSINSLKIDTTSNAVTIDNSSSGYTLTLSGGGLLVTGSNSATITRGTLKGKSTAELVIHQYSTGALTIESVVANNSGDTSLTKAGPGVLSLTATNTYSGSTNINQGVLSVASNKNLGSESAGAAININGGTLSVTQSVALDNGTKRRKIVLAGGGGTLDTPAADTTLSVTGGVTGSGGLTKTGPGRLVLSGTNAYTGLTTAREGVLEINGTLDGTAVVVDSGAALRGTGSISDAARISGVISPGAGSGSGTLTTGRQVWNTGGAYEVDINDATGIAGEAAGWDKLLMASLTQQRGFVVRLLPADGGVAGRPANFNPTVDNASYEWTIAQTATGSFDLSALSLDTTAFTGADVDASHFALLQRPDLVTPGATDLVVQYTYDVVPEASMSFVAGVGMIPLLLRRKSRTGAAPDRHRA